MQEDLGTISITTLSTVLQLDIALNDITLPQQVYPVPPATPDSSHYEVSSRARDLRELEATISLGDDDRVAAFLDDRHGSAIDARSQAIFELLVDYGRQVNAPYGAGHVVLPKVDHDEKLTPYLLCMGADPNIGAPMWGDIQTESLPNPNSHEALNHAAGISNPVVFDLLVEYGAKIENCSALHSAAASQSSEAKCISMISHLLNLGFDINGFDDVL
ncbi:hypothetical protein BDZ45DRAFT_783110 [Acephala macrosclerotiorum]|nr:hypothetical protein BDZ45DRAFT_783110 [Acephala macrosclerotiorum]